MKDFLSCDPQDIALKTFFLGPQAENQAWVLQSVQNLFIQWFKWRQTYFPGDGEAIPFENRMNPAFLQKQSELMTLIDSLIKRFEDEVPKFTPRYVGHMFSEQSLPALLGHILTLLHNPNNVSGEASKIGIQVEKEAIDDLCVMVGWPRRHGLGHFTSGGTIANFEGLSRAKNRSYQWLSLGTYLKEKALTSKSLFDLAHMGWNQFDEFHSKVNSLDFLQWKKQWLSNPIRFANHVSKVFNTNFEGPVILVSQSKHYSWPKGTQLLGMGSDRMLTVNLDIHGRMCLKHLKFRIQECREKQIPIAAVVSIAGTTELGTIDPISEISRAIEIESQQGTHLWHHVDAAYGGFLCSMLGMKDEPYVHELLEKLEGIKEANSITIDPHKLGYVPYSSGLILVKNRREYPFQDIQAPYIQFDQDNDVGLQTIEGSRSAAGAVATWLTERSIGLNPEGYGRILARTIAVKNYLQEKIIAANPHFYATNGLDSNVLCLTVTTSKGSISQSNESVRKIYQRMSPTSKSPFILSKTSLSLENYDLLLGDLIEKRKIQSNAKEVEMLRLCLMNPFFVSKETNVFYPEELIKELSSANS